MAGIGIGRNLAFAVAAAALAGCTEGGGLFAGGGGEDAPVARAATSTRLVERDVEAPQVFEAKDAALWDGRPSLGGVWVASPDAVDPERVIIRNPGNGKFVIGALFRRERLNPGPALQISSDAAAALDILAGQPVEITVVALRREEVADEPAPEVLADAGPILDTAETVETTTLASVAGAAIDKAEGKPAKPARAASAAKGAADAAAPAVAAAAGAPAAAVPAVAAAPGAGGPAVPVVPAAAAAVPKPAAPAAAAPAASGRSLVQIGIFSVEANANRASAAVGKAGVSARVLREESQGKTFWRVVAGPAAAPMTREQMLGKVKGAGFADAYLVAR